MTFKNLKFNKKILLLSASWLPVILTIHNNFISIIQINGISMRPTLNSSDFSKDWILINKYKPYNNTHINNIIVFKSPLDYNKKLCKRIINTSDNNHSFVQGDNLFNSIDSRQFGPISNGLIIGNAICIIWPPSRWKLL